MARSPNSPMHSSARLRGAAFAFAIALGLPATLDAMTPSHRQPLYHRLQASLFPPSNPGYIPLVGSPALRLATPPPARPIEPPPRALYALPPPIPEGTQAPTPPPDLAATTPDDGDGPGTAPNPPSQPPPPVRAEDVLPYFQLDDGSSADGSNPTLRFTPARPALPTSNAEYRQK